MAVATDQKTIVSATLSLLDASATLSLPDAPATSVAA